MLPTKMWRFPKKYVYVAAWIYSSHEEPNQNDIRFGYHPIRHLTIYFWFFDIDFSLNEENSFWSWFCFLSKFFRDRYIYPSKRFIQIVNDKVNNTHFFWYFYHRERATIYNINILQLSPGASGSFANNSSRDDCGVYLNAARTRAHKQLVYIYINIITWM